MVDTGFEIIDAVINNPLEAVVLFALGYFVYKYFIGGRRAYHNRVMLSHDIQHQFHMAYFNLFRKYDSFSGLKPEYIDEALKIIKMCPDVSTWGLASFLEAKLGITEIDRYRLLKALQDLGKIASIERNGQYYWSETRN